MVAIPRELAVLPLRDTVVFPESMTPLAIGQERSIKLVDDVVGGDRMLALLTTRDSENEQPGFTDLYEVGTAAVIHKMIRVPDGTLRILVQGLRRIGSRSRCRSSRTWSGASSRCRTCSRRRARSRR